MLKDLIEMCKDRIGSYENLSSRLDIAPTVISDWKAGRRKPTPYHVCQMAEIARLNVAETLFIVMQELDKEHAKSWEIWRPYGDSNPGYRRERASIFFIKLIVNICKFIPKKVNILRPHVNFQVLNERNAG